MQSASSACQLCGIHRISELTAPTQVDRSLICRHQPGIDLSTVEQELDADLMEPVSPLTREVHDTFQPKIIQLYSTLFNLHVQDAADELPSEGFWREFFLLKPVKNSFHNVLEPLLAEDLLLIQKQTQNYIRRSITELQKGSYPQNEHALENLSAFFAAALAKRYTNQSTDVIEVIAGLEQIDQVMTDFVGALETTISRSEIRSLRLQAVECAISVVTGSYQTSLVTYFIHKDFFHGLMKLVRAEPSAAPVCLSFLGLLANHNKFESQNMYQSRMEDMVNDDAMQKLVEGFANICGDVRDAYVKVQDDSPAQWSLGSTLSYVGLRALTPEAKKPPPPTEEQAKALFNDLPACQSVALLGTYSFVRANTVFASQLISTEKDSDLESPLAAFLSTTSYLCHHSYRSSRAQHYSLLALFTVRLLCDDSIIAKRLSSPEAKIEVRLARQRPPHLPYAAISRIPSAIILDILTDTISHNLRKRISISLYTTVLTLLHHILTTLSATKTRLPHHWSYIWLSLISLLRFMTTYAADLQATNRLSELQSQICAPLTSILTFSLLRGDNFLPDPPSYDDLFYKLVEASESLVKFRDAYSVMSLPSNDKLRRGVEALMSIASHYQNLVGTSKRTHQSPRQIQEIIGVGHETLPDVVDNLSSSGKGAVGVGGGDEWGHYEKWRESACKVELKKMIRTVVDDGRLLALQ